MKNNKKNEETIETVEGYTINPDTESALIINNEGMCQLILHQPDDKTLPIPQSVLLLSAIAKKIQDVDFINDIMIEHIEDLKKMGDLEVVKDPEEEKDEDVKET
jgi:hypothetical protein